MSNKISTKALLASYTILGKVSALIGLGLSYTTLPPLVIGGIASSAFWAGYMALGLAAILKTAIYDFFSTHKAHSINNKKETIAHFVHLGIITTTAAISGAGFAAAANFFFPGVMSSMGSAALACAVIGVMTGFIADQALLLADKANQHIISPLIEKCSFSQSYSLAK
ncbi:MAG: hypothetical protein QWI36_00290 [Wolbachia endosymbiont of Tyrophagus putrescentiae]|nr:hypothetical protein [Wolbachia endosymbiont of Tyrophagus putrescentiae]